MALELYKELEKAERRKNRNSSSSSHSSLHSPARYSFDSDEHTSINELDPLQANGANGKNGSIAYPNGRRASSPLPVFNRRGKLKDGRSRWRAALERWLPITQLERRLRLHRFAGSTRRVRQIRRPLLVMGRSPGRLCCFAVTLFAFILLIATASTGVYVLQKGTIDGMSPPWYPSPRGGTMKSWEQSYSKAEKLVRQMTLAEKVNITTGTGWQMGMCVGNTGPAVRVKFPSLCLQDGPLGLRFTDHITASPAGITVGATWNTDLMYKRGTMLGFEARKKGVNILLGPSVGPLGKLPAAGRNWESFGADPVLQGVAAAETIRGIQAEGVMATIKHFVGNEQEHFRQSFEWNLPNAISSNIDDRALHELYAWPFADAIRAGVASVMCSYNQVNNSYACQNSKLMNGILKDELGFQGFVQSDWLAQRSGVASALAGLDMSMPGDGYTWANGKPYWGHELSIAVLNGTVPMQRLDDMVTRIVAAWYQMEQDDETKWPPPPPEGTGGPNFSSWTDEEEGQLHPGSSNDDSKATVNQFVPATRGRFSHITLARQIAAEGIVLLKNEGKMLPLSRDGGSASATLHSSRAEPHRAKSTHKKSAHAKPANRIAGPGYKSSRLYHVAIVGEDATEASDGPNMCADRGCNKGTLASGWGSGAVEFPYLVTPLEAIRNMFHHEKVFITQLVTNKLPSRQNHSEIEYQDLCIVFVNADGGEGFIKHHDIRGDRPNLNLQNRGDKLIKNVATHCGKKNVQNKVGIGENAKYKTSPTIVVIHSIGPVIVESFIDNPNVRAVLLANLPGQESGNALVDVLFGDINPSGRLPYTMGRRLEDYGPGGQILYYPNSFVPQQNFSEGVFIDYRWFDAQNIQPRFEFGYGLSYTEFSLKNLAVIPRTPTRPPSLPSPRPPAEVEPPSYNEKIPDAKEVLFPSEIRRLNKYIYPYISDSKQIKLENATGTDMLTGHVLAMAQAKSRGSGQAGGGEGGNPSLYETLAEVDVTVVNEGEIAGQAVVQLYVKFPNNVVEEFVLSTESSSDGLESRDPTMVRQEKISFPPRVLRGFKKVHTYKSSGASSAFGADTDTQEKNMTFKLTRRDLSYWSVRQQNWVLPDGQFEIQVGFSSRNIQAKATLF